MMHHDNQHEPQDASLELMGFSLFSKAMEISKLDDAQFGELRDFAEQAAMILSRRISEHDVNSA